MSPETRAFLDAVRAAEDPSADDARRVLGGVRRAAGAALALGASAEASKASKLLTLAGAPGLKLAAVALCAVAAAGDAGDPSSAVPPRERPSTAVPSRPVFAPSAPRSAASGAAHELVESNAPVFDDRPREPLPRVRRSLRPDAPSLRGELELLADVQQALRRGDGDAALQKLDAHHTSDRQLLSERHAARVLALCAAERFDDARRAAAAFRREHPDSVQRLAIEKSCATPPADSVEK